MCEDMCPDTREAYARSDRLFGNNFREAVGVFKSMFKKDESTIPDPIKRDHKYMTGVLDSILDVWMHAPELRLGQLLENVAGRYNTAPMFYIEDKEIVEGVKKLDDEILSKRT